MQKNILIALFCLTVYSCSKDPEPILKDCAGIEEGNSVCGCSDSTAVNFDSLVTYDDGSCYYEDCAGILDGNNICDCTDSTAINFNPNATFDDGSCNYEAFIEGRTVYIVGESYNSNGQWTSCYWVNGQRFELPGGYKATDITVKNGVVYTSGTADGACYWINQERFDLPGLYSEGEAIAVHDNNVYVAGWFDNGSCYWKNDQKINLTVNRDSQAFAIGVRNNGSVYVGGYFMNNHHYFLPCFWKDGNNRTSLPVASGGDGEVYDMVLEDGNMRYYAGYILAQGKMGYVQKASYWRHTSRTTLPLGGSQWDIYGAVGNGIIISDGKVYVAGYTDWYEDINNPYTTGGWFPQYWKNGTIHDLNGGPITEFGSGAAYDIKVIDDNILVVGEATRDTSYYDSYTSACYWLNGELFYLVNAEDVPTGQSDWYHSIARGVFIE